jgi:hypothetical protein
MESSNPKSLIQLLQDLPPFSGIFRRKGWKIGPDPPETLTIWQGCVRFLKKPTELAEATQ